MKHVIELLRLKSYELLARIYFDWLAKKLGNGDFEAGIQELTRRYNDRIFGGHPFIIPESIEISAWLSENGVVRISEKDIGEINHCFDYELKNRVEEEFHHENPLNP